MAPKTLPLLLVSSPPSFSLHLSSPLSYPVVYYNSSSASLFIPDLHCSKFISQQGTPLGVEYFPVATSRRLVVLKISPGVEMCKSKIFPEKRMHTQFNCYVWTEEKVVKQGGNGSEKEKNKHTENIKKIMCE